MSRQSGSSEPFTEERDIEIVREAHAHQMDLRDYEQEMISLKRQQIEVQERAIYWQRLQICSVLALAFVLLFWLGYLLTKVTPLGSY